MQRASSEVEVELRFDERGPTFGDLFAIVGYLNPNFPPSGSFAFAELEHLQFSQVDDYFGARTTSGEGDDVVVWLYPVVNGSVVDHHPGPFDALRISYSVHRNPSYRKDHFIACVQSMLEALPVRPIFRGKELESMESLRHEIESIIRYWRGRGIEVGSSEAMAVDG